MPLPSKGLLHGDGGGGGAGGVRVRAGAIPASEADRHISLSGVGGLRRN